MTIKNRIIFSVFIISIEIYIFKSNKPGTYSNIFPFAVGGTFGWLPIAQQQPLQHGPLARYAKLRVRMRRECRERFPHHRR